MSDEPLDTLEEQLRAGGARVSEGTFKVDARRALAKLREYRLAEPHAWVLEVLRAAATTGAKEVTVETDADDVKVRFDGAPFAPEVMNDLLAQALDSKGQGDRQAARYLSLGVAGALGLEPKWIRVHSGQVGLEILPPDDVRPLSVPHATGGTFVHVRKRLGWNVIKASIADTSPEETAIFKAGPAFGPRLTHNGKAVNGDRFPGGFVCSVTFKDDEMEIVVGVPAKAKHGQLVFDVGGVVVARREVDLPGRFLVAWARCDAMRRNASGSDVVDADPTVKRVRAKVDALALEATQLMGERLALRAAPEAWRKKYQAYAIEVAAAPKQHAAVRPLLDLFPVIPGLYDEWNTPADFAAEHKAGRPIYFTTAHFPKGSYPKPIIRVDDDQFDPIEKLLPSGSKRVDAAKQVRLKVRAAEARARWLGTPIEPAQLPPGKFVARVPVKGPSLEGEVALVSKANAGAFVRLLCQGRFVQQGEISTLAPLRLRAVVDTKKDVPDALWAEMPSDKLMRTVLDAVEDAAQGAVLAAVGNPELLSHVHDLLIRLANTGTTLSGLPDALRQAPLFEVVGGGKISLQLLSAHDRWHFVRDWAPHPLLSGEPVLILPAELRQALGKLAPKRLVDAEPRLQREREIRQRLSGRPLQPELTGVRVVVDLEGEGLKGQVGLPRVVDHGLNLRLLRHGVLLERNRITDFHELATAVVECPDFVPNDDWDTAARDGAWDRAIAAIKAGVEKLPGVLVDQYPFPLDQLGPAHEQFLTQFMRKHLVPGGDPHPAAQRIAHAPLFRTVSGPTSLNALKGQLGATHQVWSLPEQSATPAPADLEGMVLVFARPEHAALLSALLGRQVADATPELERNRRRRRYLERPLLRLAPPDGALLPTAVEGDGVRGVIGFTEQDAGATLQLLVADRLFAVERFSAQLPLTGALIVDGVDTAEPQLPPVARAAVHAVLGVAEVRVLRRAIESLGSPGARRLALRALAGRLDRGLPADVASALRDLPLFPCTDGQTRTARALDAGKRVLFVTRAIEGEPASKDPVVVATEPGVLAALKRWTTEDVTDSLRLELDERSARQRLPQVDALALGPDAIWRCAVTGDGLTGEVGIVPAGGGTLRLFQDRRPLSVIEGVLPAPLTAIVNCDGLKPAAFGKGVLMDGQYDRVLAALRDDASVLLDRAADAVFAASEEERKPLAALLAPLAFWQRARKQKAARLVRMPLFETSAGKFVSLDQLHDEQKRHKSVLWSHERGEPLNDARWIWRPREGEVDLFGGKLNLKDATTSILHAREVRGRRKVTALEVPVPGAWREVLGGGTIEGEVGLHDRPTRALAVALHRERVPLEQLVSDHPVGGVAAINADALTPNGDWTRAARNLVFKGVMSDVEDALERLVARRLEHRDLFWREYAEAALRWKRGPGGPLQQVIPRLALFRGLDLRERTVGEVLEAHARFGRVLVAEPGLKAPDDRLVLEQTPETEALLVVLELKAEDITALVKRKGALQDELKARRLKSLVFEGAPIARHAVRGDGFRGELVVLGPGEPAEVVLARDGIRVCTRPIGKGLPVGGVLDVDRLAVNDDWTRADLSKDVSDAVDAEIPLLFAALAARAPGLDAADRPRARAAALAYLVHEGVTSARHLERMKGAAAALAAAPLFLTEGGLWVGLTAVADQVQRRGWVSVFEQSWRKRDTRDELVLRAATLREPWISALEEALGAACVERVRDVGLWREQLAERDPPATTPEGEGLRRLRQQMKLLRAGALGHATPDELEDVRLRTGGAKAAIGYDPARKLALLDGDRPEIRRALEEIPRRPERLYVLLAAIYGAVNRALERITDDDEAELLAALAVHLAVNPKCLTPSEPK